MTRDEGKSRSQLKRDHRALKDLGARLVALAPRQLETIPLTGRTRTAVEAARDMTRSALQRQLRHIASLIADEDVAAIRGALASASRPHAREVAALHRAEIWREDLLSGEEEALRRFVEQHPGCDRQRMEGWIHEARKERAAGKPPRASRLLFRYLRELLS